MKRTRKSLFISTILMVVLLIVAISTATFAWYSSQNQAKAENAKLTTASTTAANIGIYFEGGGGGAGSAVSKVIFGAVTSLKPLVPTTDPETTDPADLKFNEGIVTMNLNNQRVFKQVNHPETPWKQIEAETENTELYIENLDPDASRKVAIETKINVGEANFEVGAPGLNAVEATQTTIKNEAKDALRVAIYVKEGSADAQYLGTYGKGAAKYGIPEEGEPAATFGTVFSTNDGTFTKFDAVGGGSPVALHIYAWLEGPDIEASHSLVSVTFSLTFTAGNPKSVEGESGEGD